MWFTGQVRSCDRLSVMDVEDKEREFLAGKETIPN